MMSVRLGEQLERRLAQVARATDKSVSDVLREAVRKHCDEVQVCRLGERLADVVGAVQSRGGRSTKTGRAFTKLVARNNSDRGRRRT